MLCEVTDFGFFAELEFATQNLKLVCQYFDEGGFAGTVRAKQTNPVAG